MWLCRQVLQLSHVLGATVGATWQLCIDSVSLARQLAGKAW